MNSCFDCGKRIIVFGDLAKSLCISCDEKRENKV